MAVEGRQDRWAFKAGADLSTYQFRVVQLDTNGNIVLADGTGKPIGVLVDMPNQNEYGTVVIAGIAKAVAGGAVAAGAYLSVDTQGRVVTATDTVVPTGATYAPGAQGTRIIGQALSAASAAGEFVTLVLARGLA